MIIGENLEVFNPIQGLTSKIATVSQLKETYRVASLIIEELDDASLGEIIQGTSGDVDRFMETLFSETFISLYGSSGLVKDSSPIYLEKLSTNIEETLRKANLNYFISTVLPEFQVNWHHLEWGQLIQQYNKLAIIAPRNHGKSYYFSHAYPIWKLYRYNSSTPKQLGKKQADGQRGYLISNETDLVQDFLEQIKITVEENEYLRENLLPSDKNLWIKNSIRTKNGARLNIKSYGGSFRGRHPSWIVCDDFLKDSVIYSEVQRSKSKDYFHSVIMNAINPGGQVIVVGTPFHATDLYGDLKEKKGVGGWRVFEYPAISPEGDVLWPDRFTYEDLMEKKESQGNIIFSRENLCRPITSDSSIFPWEILKRSMVGMEEYKLTTNIESFPKKFSRVITACDLALSANVGADYSVFSTWGIDDTYKEMWLIHFWRGKGKTYGQQINTIKSINKNFRPDSIVIEANAFQKMFADMVAEEDLPVIPHTTTAANKNDLRSGLPGLVLLFEKGRIKLPTGDKFSKDIADFILAEFGSVAWTDKGIQGIGEHDDCVMSAWLAKRGADHIGNGKFGLFFLDED